MKFDQLHARAITRCIDLHIPFAWVSRPGDAEPLFFASMHVGDQAGDGGQRFAVAEFGQGDAVKPCFIEKALSPDQILALPADFPPLPAPEVAPLGAGTQIDEYLEQVQTVVNQLKTNDNKVVMSRVIAVRTAQNLIPAMECYFTRFSSAVAFVYFTPRTGLWFGASPELLLDYDAGSRRLHTMSLAGTRKVDHAHMPWDAKNVREHRYVTDYIIDTLRSLGLEPEIHDSTPVRFGRLEHLCDRITAEGCIDVFKVIAALSPTPAICGYPKDYAYGVICRTESHPRRSYGGWFAVCDDSRVTAHVNLRSAMVGSDEGGLLYNIYVGGGITADSDPQTELAETQAKATGLLEAITQ